MRKLLLMLSLFLTAHTAPSAAAVPDQATLTESEYQEIAKEAYTYFYPLVLMDITRRVMTNVEAGKTPGRGPMNAFHHIRTFPTGDMKDVVRPNFDTLYSVAWLDLTKGPQLISAPNTQGRYYVLPLMDMWTDVFASVGKRTTGTEAARFVVTEAGWKGKLPPGIERIESPTPYVWIIGRIQTNTAQDFAAVNSLQDGFQVSPLSPSSQSSIKTIFTVDPTVDMKTPPLDQVNQMPALDFFQYAAELMKIHKPHLIDQTFLFSLKKIGIVPGQSLEIKSDLIRSALLAGATAGLKSMMSQVNSIGDIINGWQVSREGIGVYGNSYLKRAIVAMGGLGANLPRDAIYPLAVADAEGSVMNGRNNYVLHFDKDDLPPVEAFWSLTMYDAQGFQVPNPLNRFALGDRDPLRYNPDGSLDIYIQRESPGAEREANWLPSPDGVLGLTMRLYDPKPAALDGTWNPPAIQHMNQ